MSLDAHARPPDCMRALFKKWQRASIQEIEASDKIIDLSHHENISVSQVRQSAGVPCETLLEASNTFLRGPSTHYADHLSGAFTPRYELTALPGLFLYPSLLSDDIQIALLNKLLHRDLSNACHRSNLHLHYDIPYFGREVGKDPADASASFFLADPAQVLPPRDASIHKPLTVKQMLDRKLRWITLGGQYDWTTKTYPSENPPRFPEDIACLLRRLFPSIDAQAAIVNLYTPGDTLSVHRDVSEECDRGLISISIGCDGLFVIGNEDGSQSATLRLRSGDVVLMSDSARYAWHAVPSILPGTCPTWLQHWPAINSNSEFDLWKGWLAHKRINLNIRQMRV